MLRNRVEHNAPVKSNTAKTWSYGTLAYGDEGVRQTAELMAEFAKRDANTPQVRKLVNEIKTYAKTDRERLFAAYRWITKHVRYKEDGANEYVRSPRHIIATELEGDCDDMATLFAAIALQLGAEVWFKVIAWKPQNAPENPFTHVYNLVLIRDEGIVVPVDCVMTLNGFANEKQDVLRYKIYSMY